MSSRAPRMFRPLGTPAARTGQAKDPASVPIVPVPADAPPPPVRHHRLGRPFARYCYVGPDGQPWMHVYRFETSDTGKTFLPCSFCQRKDGTRRWEWKNLPPPRPLYHLDRLSAAGTGPVVLCEGEKAADAAAALLPGWVATTTPGGAGSAGQADLAPLRDRHVVIWPDADEPGRRYAATLARLLADIAASVRIAKPPNRAPAGWDAADARAEGWDGESARAFIAKAQASSGTAQDLPVAAAHGDGLSSAAGASPRASIKDRLLADLPGLALWHTPDRVAYGTIDLNGHRENWPLRSNEFRSWLTWHADRALGATLPGQTLEEVVRVYEARALHGSPCFATWRRVAEADGSIYVDIGDDRRRCVRITADGWTVTDDAPVKFLRSPTMGALPVPARGGSINELRRFLNPGLSDDDFRLVIGFLIGCFHPCGPYPVLVLRGEQGSAKSALTRLVKRLVDPAMPETRSLPGAEEDLVAAAVNARLLAFDNVSAIAPWLSDAICRLSTGSGTSVRRHYTHHEEAVFAGARPLVLNGIPDFVTRPDLAARSIVIDLPPIPRERRQTEREIERTFRDAAPALFGALLDGVASALRHHRSEQPGGNERMADFLNWVTAAEPGLGWDGGAFRSAYAGNQEELLETALQADTLALAVMNLVETEDWSGEPAELLKALEARNPDAAKLHWEWPKNPSALSGRLRRAAPVLRNCGVVFDNGRRGGRRLIVIRNLRRQPD